MSTKLAAVVLTLAATAATLPAQADTPAEWQAVTSNLKVSLEQAIQQATQVVPGKVFEIELDDGDGSGPRYEAQILTPTGDSVEVWIDGVTGQARQHEHDGKAKRKDIERAAQAKLDIQQAIAAAIKHTPGKAVKAELDRHWGKTTYQVDVLQSDHTVMEIKLNAEDGTILRAKRD